eukprot:c6139_g1_i1 orf=43-261(+)
MRAPLHRGEEGVGYGSLGVIFFGGLMKGKGEENMDMLLSGATLRQDTATYFMNFKFSPSSFGPCMVACNYQL